MKNYITNFINGIFSVNKSEKYILDLIRRMSVVNNAKSSDKSISFKAHREAETLYNKDFIPILIHVINCRNNSNDKNIRKGAYFILSKLLRKHKDLIAVQFLINQVHKESDKYVISSLLNQISELEKPDTVDIEPIVHNVDNQNWIIRHSAIQALKKSEGSKARQVVLDIVNNNSKELKKNQNDIVYAISVLSDIGKGENLPLLKDLTSSNIRDIRDSAKYAIESINKRNIH